MDESDGVLLPPYGDVLLYAAADVPQVDDVAAEDAGGAVL